MADDLLLPAGSRLVHIGPHKTGTTAIQGALSNQRQQLRELGVHYPGTGLQAYQATLGLTGRHGRRGTPTPQETWWLDLVDEVKRAGDDRVVISSESLSNAETDQIERLADDLGRDRVHVVRMVRRYDALLPSQWHQLIVQGKTRDFPSWLDRVMANPEQPFWKRHRFDGLTGRWADVVGADRVTVVVVDDSDPGWLLRVFERFLGLDAGTLLLDRDRSNRSLNAAEAEAIRQVNGVLDRFGWSGLTHLAYVRGAARRGLRGVAGDSTGGRIAVPERWHSALAEATAVDRQRLERLGVRIVGDLDWLDPDFKPGSDQPAQLSLSGESVVAAVAAVIRRAESEPRFPLEGSPGADFLAVGGDAVLSPEGQRLVSVLEDAAAELTWAPAWVSRYVHGGVVAGLRAATQGAEAWTLLTEAEPADLPDERFSPRLVAAAICGAIAAADARLDG